MKILTPVFIIVALFLIVGAAFLVLDHEQKPAQIAENKPVLGEAIKDIHIEEIDIKAISPKINGVCFVGGRRVIEGTAFEPVKSSGCRLGLFYALCI